MRGVVVAMLGGGTEMLGGGTEMLGAGAVSKQWSFVAIRLSLINVGNILLHTSHMSKVPKVRNWRLHVCWNF